MSLAEHERFSLVREPRSLSYRKRLAGLAEIVSHLIGDRDSPRMAREHDRVEDGALIDSLREMSVQFENIAWLIDSSHIIVIIYGVDKNTYVVQYSLFGQSFDIFARRVTVAELPMVGREGDWPTTAIFGGVEGFAERYKLKDTSIEGAFLAGLSTVIGLISRYYAELASRTLANREVEKVPKINDFIDIGECIEIGERCPDDLSFDLGTSSTTASIGSPSSVALGGYRKPFGLSDSVVPRPAVDRPFFLAIWSEVSRMLKRALVLNSPRHRPAGRLSYMVGLVGAIAFMALGLGPSWIGFTVGFLPASVLAAWAVTQDA